MSRAGATPRRRCRAAALALCALGLVAACGQEPVAGAGASGPRRTALVSRPAGSPTAMDEPLEACIAANLRGAGYDELAGRDARRKLRRLQVKADCQAQLGR